MVRFRSRKRRKKNVQIAGTSGRQGRGTACTCPEVAAAAVVVADLDHRFSLRKYTKAVAEQTIFSMKKVRQRMSQLSV